MLTLRRSAPATGTQATSRPSMARCTARSPESNCARRDSGGGPRPHGAQRLGAIAEGYCSVVLAEGGDQRRHRLRPEPWEVAGDDRGRRANGQGGQDAAQRTLAGNSSSTTSRPNRLNPSGSPPTATTGEHPAAGQDIREATGHRDAVDLDHGLVDAHAPARAATQHRADREAPSTLGGDAAGVELQHEHGDARRLRRLRRWPRPSAAGHVGSAGSPDWSRRPSARSPIRASRWRAARRAHGDSRRDMPRSARCRRVRGCRARPTRSGNEGWPRRPRRPGRVDRRAARQAPGEAR